MIAEQNKTHGNYSLESLMYGENVHVNFHILKHETPTKNFGNIPLRNLTKSGV